MSLQTDPPQQLSFPRPLADGSSVTLKLFNPSDIIVAFKLKTTSPKQYCVRPNSGHVLPHQSVHVSVSLQYTKVEPPPGFKCRDKFLVQSVAVSASEADLPSADLWAMIEKTRKEAIIEHKLRCAYLDPQSPSKAESTTDSSRYSLQGAAPSSSNSASNAEGVISKYNYVSQYPSLPANPLSSIDTPENALLPQHMSGLVSSSSSLNSAVPIVPVSSAASTFLLNSQELPDSKPKLATVDSVSEGPSNLSPVSRPSSLASQSHKTPSFIPPSGQTDESLERYISTLETQLAHAKNELMERDRIIARLKSQANEIRHRPTIAASESVAQVITKTVVNPNYYSPQLVFIIALICFLAGVIVF